MRFRGAVAVSLMLSVVLSGCTMWGEKKNPTWKSATSGEQFNRLLWDDLSSGRWTDVSDRIAPLAIYNDGAESFSGREAILARWKALGYKGAQVGDVQTQPAGSDMVTTYRVALSGGQTLRAMSVWQPVKSGWVLIAHSTSPAQ